MSGAKNAKPYREKPTWREEPVDSPWLFVLCVLALLAIVWLGVR